MIGEIKTLEERKTELLKKGKEKGFITFEELFQANSEMWIKPLFLSASTINPKSSTSFIVTFKISPTL